MGLDMSLMQRIKDQDFIEDPTDVELIYWRKANAIHNFFVGDKHYKSCDHVPVTRDMLGQLLDKCTAILKDKSKAPEILPTTVGFFFGGIEYDQYYFDDIKRTIDKVVPILSNGDFKDGDLYYYGWY